MSNTGQLDLKAVMNDCFKITTRADTVNSQNNAYYPGVLYAFTGGAGGEKFRPAVLVDQSSQSSCSASRANTASSYVRRMCYCVSSAPVVGDPHIKTLHGDRCTVMKQGTFLAWSFRKDSGNSGVEWQLLVSYVRLDTSRFWP